MAINFRDSRERSRLANSVRANWETAHADRERRNRLIEIYESRPAWYRPSSSKETDTLVNNFVQFVRGHIITLAYNVPKWSVRARTMQARPLAFPIETLLNRLNDLLDMRSLMQSWALDSAFGYAVAKTKIGIAPKGVSSAVSPRAYRVPPNHTILDMTAQSVRESTLFGDFYLVPLNEARNYQGFDPDLRVALSEWSENSSERMLPPDTDRYNYSEAMTRLVDIYFPTRGVVATWPCKSDTFSEIATMPPLVVTPTPVNPYTYMQLTPIPDKVGEYALLEALRPLHELSNDAFTKAAQQARMSKRNPIFRLGSDDDMDSVLRAPDNEAAGLEEPDSLGLYTLPGPDPSLLSIGQMALGLFSQFGGNLEVALGQSAGANTARQTQALMGQIQAVQSVARTEFEHFLSDVGKKLATLAFQSESFSLNSMVRVPGTTVDVNVGWGPPQLLPRSAAIDDFLFEVVPLSTALRPPELRLQQLQAASQGIMQWMVAKAQGAPINLGAVIQSFAKAYDQVPEIQEWWSGEDPPVMQQAANTYQSLASPPGQSKREITYQGQGRGGPQAPPQQEGGLQMGGGV